MEQIIKSATLKDGDLDLINKYSIRPLKSEEVFVFSVTLCDNEIDRDFEAFDDEALKILSELYVGKTGIFDHDPSSKNQSARIYSTSLETGEGLTSYGAEKKLLKAKAYMVRSQRLKDTILEIDAGIIKEVSIGCSIKTKVCSICLSQYDGSCNHTPGQEYDGKLCYIKLTHPYDAYEWSFVAIPAQRGAGVTKHYLNSQKSEFNDLKNMSFENAYMNNLKKEVIKLAFLNSFMNDDKSLSSIVNKMNINELESLKKEFLKKLHKTSPQLQLGNPQLGYVDTKTKESIEDFKI